MQQECLCIDPGPLREQSGLGANTGLPDGKIDFQYSENWENGKI